MDQHIWSAFIYVCDWHIIVYLQVTLPIDHVYCDECLDSFESIAVVLFFGIVLVDFFLSHKTLLWI